MSDTPEAPLSEHEMHDIADRLLVAITAGDAEAVRGIYAHDAQIWHNFDQRDQNVEENLATLVDLHRRASNLTYTEIRRWLSGTSKYQAVKFSYPATKTFDAQGRVDFQWYRERTGYILANGSVQQYGY
mgnify:CR=1 FL=1